MMMLGPLHNLLSALLPAPLTLEAREQIPLRQGGTF